MAKSNYQARADTKSDLQNESITTMDAFSNPAARIGFGTMDLLQATEYPLTRMTQNYTLLTSLYRENWIVQNIIATIPNDVVRKWYTVNCDISPEMQSRLIQLERKSQIRKKILQGMYWGRLYGGAAGVIMIKGQTDMSQPLNADEVFPDSFLGLQILDRWNGIYPESNLVTDTSDPDFGLPEYYTIRDEESGGTVLRVHHSRVVRFVGRELPYMERVAEQYWGESEIEAVYNELVKRDNVSANIAALTFRANINYLESDSLDQMLGTANTEVQRRFWRTLQAQSMIESNFGTRVLNKGDAIHNTQYTFTGLPDVYDRFMMDVAGAARTPVTKLFGRSPAGLNATGESDMQNYYDYIDGIRETEFRGIIERLLPVMAMSAWGTVPQDVNIDFPPMWTPDAREIAEIAERKTSAVIAAYQNDLIDMATALKELQAMSEETGMYSCISDEAILAGNGKTYSSQRMRGDPFVGLSIPDTDMDGDELNG